MTASMSRLRYALQIVAAVALLLAAGWVMVLAAIWMRTRHHKRRLAEGL